MDEKISRSLTNFLRMCYKESGFPDPEDSRSQDGPRQRTVAFNFYLPSVP
jgi:hypothetical protein